MRRSFDQATADNVEVRSIVVINPGNPCGSVLPLHTIRDILAFAAAEGLVVFADEVYQVREGPPVGAHQNRALHRAVWGRLLLTLFPRLAPRHALHCVTCPVTHGAPPPPRSAGAYATPLRVQDNVYTEGCEFHSFKKALRMLQHEHKGEPGHPIHKAQLISFHSTSKGLSVGSGVPAAARGRGGDGGPRGRTATAATGGKGTCALTEGCGSGQTPATPDLAVTRGVGHPQAGVVRVHPGQALSERGTRMPWGTVGAPRPRVPWTFLQM